MYKRQGWTWWAAAAAGALGLLAVFLRRHLPEKLRLRAAVMLFSLCAGLVYYGGYQNLVQRPVLDRCGREAAFSATVENYGQPVSYTHLDVYKRQGSGTAEERGGIRHVLPAGERLVQIQHIRENGR